MKALSNGIPAHLLLLTWLPLILLACSHLAFAVTPSAREFTSGNRLKFSTSGHPKSKGLKMVVSYPKSWRAAEGERPNIVQKFVSDGGHGLEMAMIITKALPLSPGESLSDSDLREFFAPEQMKAMIPPGATFLTAKATTIDAVPAGIVEYRLHQDRAGMSINMQLISYMFIYGATMVQFQCAVGTPGSTTDDSLSRQMDQFRSLFFLMANSIVLEGKWK